MYVLEEWCPIPGCPWYIRESSCAGGKAWISSWQWAAEASLIQLRLSVMVWPMREMSGIFLKRRERQRGVFPLV